MRVFSLAMLFAAAVWAQSNPLTQAITARYDAVKLNLIETAAEMPEEDYSYKLTPGQREFGGWIEHTAQGNYGLCAAIHGVAAPDTSHLNSLMTKAELQKALKDSFDYCDAALKSSNDQKALTEVKGKYPVNAMIGLVASLNEHYGNLVGYLRTKGLTPPSTARSKSR